MVLIKECDDGFDIVYTVEDYYCGPLYGVANLNGIPHTYQRIFDNSIDDWSDVYKLKSILKEELDLIMEAWDLWLNWLNEFDECKVNLDTHPVLPSEKKRYHEIKNLTKHCYDMNGISDIKLMVGIFKIRYMEKKNDFSNVNISKVPLQVMWKKPELLEKE